VIGVDQEELTQDACLNGKLQARLRQEGLIS
jgi:hypothetical protein